MSDPIYFLDNPKHKEELRRLAAMGGQTVCVASTQSEAHNYIRIENLRPSYDKGMLAGDARVSGSKP